MSATTTAAVTTDVLATYIHGEMTFNAVSSTAAAIRRDITRPDTYWTGIQTWIAMVGYGKPWDHKPYILKTYGAWSADATAARRFPHDTWSNIHYGYVGRAVGFASWTLRAGAGGAQFKNDADKAKQAYAARAARTLMDPNYWSRRMDKVGDADALGALDHPEDQVAIMIGADLFDAKGATVTAAHILAAIRAVPGKLGTKPL